MRRRFSYGITWGLVRMAVMTMVVLNGAYLPSVFAAPADEVRALLEQGRIDDAYRIASQSPGELGRPAFDFYYGIAAINSGNPSQGVLALERYLLSVPGNLSARLELARGYYLLNDDGRARDEFDAILAAKPPAEIARAVQVYLAAIAARAARRQTSFAISIEFGGGRDSNVQSGVSDPNITLPVFGDITLTDSALARADRFTSLALAGRVAVPFNAQWALFAHAGADLRAHREADLYDQNTFSAATGVSFTRGKALYKFTLGGTSQTLDNNRYRDTWSGGVDYARQLADAGAISFGAQAARFRYTGENAVRDANYFSLQSGYRHLFGGAAQSELDASLSVAREDILREGFAALSRDLWGGRFGVSVTPLPLLTVGLGASYLKSDYRAEDALLLVTRRDAYHAWELTANYAFTPQWSMRGEYVIARNRSNLPLYDYQRRIGQLKLRYDFR